MFSKSVTGLTEDPDLPALAQALNPQLMLQLIATSAGLYRENCHGLSCTAEVLSHKLGQRCTIRYMLTRPGELGQPVNPVSVIGKVYAKLPLAGRLYRRIEALRDGPFRDSGPLCIPAPMMLQQELGLVLQEYVYGDDLSHIFSAGDSDVPLSLAGHWLARLHAAAPVAGLTPMSYAYELGKVDRWCEYIAPCFTAAGSHAQRLTRTQKALHRLASEMPPYQPVMIHKDFYYRNVLWGGQRLSVLDFDELSIGDPALDVGHFFAHSQNLAYRVSGRFDAYAGQTRTFLQSYQERAPLRLESRLPFYRAYTFLKLAATEVSRKESKWERMIRVLVGLACREADCQLDTANLRELEGSAEQA